MNPKKYFKTIRKINRQFHALFLNYGCIQCMQDATQCHHLDKKQFTICEGKNKHFRQFMSELDKCVPVCDRCHKKIHGKNPPILITEIFKAWWIANKMKLLHETPYFAQRNSIIAHNEIY